MQGGISFGSLGACQMWRTVLGESGIHFGCHHEGGRSHGVRQFWEGDLALEDTME